MISKGDALRKIRFSNLGMKADFAKIVKGFFDEQKAECEGCSKKDETIAKLNAKLEESKAPVSTNIEGGETKKEKRDRLFIEAKELGLSNYAKMKTEDLEVLVENTKELEY